MNMNYTKLTNEFIAIINQLIYFTLLSKHMWTKYNTDQITNKLGNNSAGGVNIAPKCWPPSLLSNFWQNPCNLKCENFHTFNLFFSVAKANLEVQMSVRLLVCLSESKTPKKHKINRLTYSTSTTPLTTSQHHNTTQHNITTPHNITTQHNTTSHTTSHHNTISSHNIITQHHHTITTILLIIHFIFYLSDF